MNNKWGIVGPGISDDQKVAEALEELTAGNYHDGRALIETRMGTTPSVVFVAVRRLTHEDVDLVGVYSTREAAQRAIDQEAGPTRFDPTVEAFTLDDIAQERTI